MCRGLIKNVRTEKRGLIKKEVVYRQMKEKETCFLCFDGVVDQSKIRKNNTK